MGLFGRKGTLYHGDPDHFRQEYYGLQPDSNHSAGVDTINYLVLASQHPYLGTCPLSMFLAPSGEGAFERNHYEHCLPMGPFPLDIVVLSKKSRQIKRGSGFFVGLIHRFQKTRYPMLCVGFKGRPTNLTTHTPTEFDCESGPETAHLRKS